MEILFQNETVAVIFDREDDQIFVAELPLPDEGGVAYQYTYMPELPPMQYGIPTSSNATRIRKLLELKVEEIILSGHEVSPYTAGPTKIQIGDTTTDIPVGKPESEIIEYISEIIEYVKEHL